MDIVFSSDLHVDHPQLKVNWPTADICVIGGDIANTVGDTLKVLRRVSQKYRHVVFVLGNHEHYSNKAKKVSRRRSITDTERAISSQVPNNVHVLTWDHPHVDIDGVHFVGLTGWYSCDIETPGSVIDPVEMYKKMDTLHFNDAFNIGFTAHGEDHPWTLAKRDADVVRETIVAITDDRPIVVVTHMPPRRDWIRWTGVAAKDATNLFYVNMWMSRVIDDLSDRIALWYSGHVHHFRETRVGSMIGLLNPRGYPGNVPGWSPVVISTDEFCR